MKRSFGFALALGGGFFIREIMQFNRGLGGFGVARRRITAENRRLHSNQNPVNECNCNVSPTVNRASGTLSFSGDPGCGSVIVSQHMVSVG